MGMYLLCTGQQAAHNHVYECLPAKMEQQLISITAQMPDNDQVQLLSGLGRA